MTLFYSAIVVAAITFAIAVVYNTWLKKPITTATVEPEKLIGTMFKKKEISPEGAQFRVTLLNAIVNVEDDIRSRLITEDQKNRIVDDLIKAIPDLLAAAIKSGNAEFIICYAHIYSMSSGIYSMSSGDKERVFKEIYPKLCEKLKSLSIPHTIPGNITFNVKELKKFTSYEKTKILT